MLSGETVERRASAGAARARARRRSTSTCSPRSSGRRCSTRTRSRRRRPGRRRSSLRAIALEAVDRGGFALVRPPGHHALADRAMGFCLVNNIAVAARYAQAELGARTRGDRRLRRPPRQRHRGDLPGRPRRCSSSRCTSGRSIPARAARGRATRRRSTSRCRPAPATRSTCAPSTEQVEPAVRAFAPELVLVSAGFDAHAEDPLGGMDVSDGRLPRALHGRCAALAPRAAPPCSRAATTSRRCRASSRRRATGFSSGG